MNPLTCTYRMVVVDQWMLPYISQSLSVNIKNILKIGTVKSVDKSLHYLDMSQKYSGFY